ncbi:FK506-binding protein 15 [Brachionichthys hirsutus]|uniref:FK506-binding protein 15 n=1 Tax=Brachionichthys hirsutus TaxID=412623 RepID=UPI003604DC3B
MQTDCPTLSQFLTVWGEDLKFVNMWVLGDGGDYQWKEFQGAKLASLFGLDQQASRGNESFQYTAPKQPRKSSNAASAPQKPAPPPGAPVVLFATAVQTFRHINGQYVNQGKLGAAVLGNHTTKEYKLLLYLSQQKQVTTANLHLGFAFTAQPNNYCTFYDDQRQNWSLMFESEKAASDFCKELCLAKVNSTALLDVVVVQDLCLGEGQAVENGDALEVEYTGWLLLDNAIGQMFDSNQNKDKLLRLKVGAGKVIKGWEEGMLGMKKAGRRFIIVPPNLAYGSKGVSNIPSNSTLIFEVELRRVKFAKDIGSDQACASSKNSAAPSPDPSPGPSVENLAPEPQGPTISSGPGTPGEPQFWTKSNSFGEQLENPDATKAKLISRMAKMGQPMLPFLAGVSDSELEDTGGSRGNDRLMGPSPAHASAASPVAAHVHHHPSPPPPSALLPVMTTVAPHYGLPGSSHTVQPHSYTQASVQPPQTVPYIGSSDVTAFLMTEARQHSTEIRLSVGKVADKVEQLASKIDELQRQGGASVGMSGVSMETSMITHNIQRIVQENECLKKEVFEKSFRIEEQNHKIGELINQNQRYMEQNHLVLEKRNDSLKSTSEQSQARLLQAEQDKVRLTEHLASCTARLSQLQLEATAHQQNAFDLQSKLSSAVQDSDGQSQSLSVLETQLDEVKEAAERAQSQYRLEKQRRKDMELRVNNMEEELQDMKTDRERLERTLVERKQKWQAEHQRREEEVEEIRKSSQQELDNLRVVLHKGRTSTDNAASAQLSQLQAELEEEYRGKCEQLLASTKAQHNRDMAELTERRDTLQDELTQLQQKFTDLKRSRDSGEQNFLQHNRETEELQALQQKYTALEQQEEAVKKKLESRVTELEMKLKLAEQGNAGNTAAEVKRVMNGVFRSLRGEFDVTESYSGQDVLALIVTTIKNVTLQLLIGSDRASLRPSKNAEEVNNEKKKMEDHQNVNGAMKVNEDRVTEAGCHQVTEIQMGQEGEAEKQMDIVSESNAQSQAEALAAAGRKAQEMTEVEQKQTESFIPESSREEKDTNKSAESSREEKDSNKSAESFREEKDSNKEAAEEKEGDGDHVEETRAASPKDFGPPTKPPPPPNGLHESSGQDTSLTGGMCKDNGEEPFIPVTVTHPANPHTGPSEEEEEEMSLKGRPPPSPLFGDEDDGDLDWMS